MMRICFVTSGSLADYTERQSAGQTDVILCGFQALGEVSYERELKGETGLFADVALLSRLLIHNDGACTKMDFDIGTVGFSNRPAKNAYQ